jgi:hypothetical protein
MLQPLPHCLSEEERFESKRCARGNTCAHFPVCFVQRPGKAKKDDAQLFAGTDISLRFTTDTKPIKGMPGAGKTIAQFLKGKKGTVRVAGISLAGALAPAVALYLQDNSMLPDAWALRRISAKK